MSRAASDWPDVKACKQNVSHFRPRLLTCFLHTFTSRWWWKYDQSMRPSYSPAGWRNSQWTNDQMINYCDRSIKHQTEQNNRNNIAENQSTLVSGFNLCQIPLKYHSKVITPPPHTPHPLTPSHILTPSPSLSLSMPLPVCWKTKFQNYSLPNKKTLSGTRDN